MTPQRKLSSGFGPRSTARDVVAGLDLSGNLAIVTGGYSGLGIETVAALAGGGAQVIVPARRTGVARDALEARGLRDVEVEETDLSDLASVRAFTERFLATGRSVAMLINNAGILRTP